MDINDMTIAERLTRLGYGYANDTYPRNDGRKMIYAIGQEGYAIDYMTAAEAALFCTDLGG